MERYQSLARFAFALSLVVAGLVKPCHAEPPRNSTATHEPVRQRVAKLPRITSALRTFETQRHHFLKRVLRSDAGKPLLSWRVALLPYLGLEELHAQFHLDEPWDSQHNRTLIGRMPDVFDLGVGPEREKNAAAGTTQVVLPVMEGSLWYGDEDNERCIYDVQDGSVYTLAAFEAPPEAAVVWTKPEDLSLNPENIGRDMFGQREECLITTLDGAVHRIAKSTSNDDLKALITFDGADEVIWENFKPWLKARQAQANPTPLPQRRELDWTFGIPEHATDTILEKILRKKPTVTSLSLAHTQVTDAGLIHLVGLPRLKRVSLNDTQLTDAGLKHLGAVTSLEWLDLREAPVTDAGLEHLQGLTNLRTLILTDLPVTDAGLAHLQGLASLETLILTRTEVSSAGLVHLQGMTKLETLFLTSTRVDDAGLGYLQSLQSLKTLNLDLTQVTDAGLEQLKGLQNLKSLGLMFTSVTDAGVKDLKTGLPKRCWFATGSLLDPNRGTSLSFSAVKPIEGIVNEGKWKFYARARQNESIALYDLLTDPRERNNVAEANPEVVKRLQDQLRHLVLTSSPSDAISEWLRYHGADR